MQDIVLKTIDGTQNTYQNVDKIAIPTPDGSTAVFTACEAVSKTIEPDFSSGDMKVDIPAGELITDLTVKKPEELIPENIPEGQYIAGVGPGTFQGGGSGGDAGFSVKAIAERTISGVVADSEITSLASYAFWGCSQITKAVFPACSKVGNAVFSGCTSLSSAELDYANVSRIGERAFAGTKISGTLSFPSCTYIGEGAFSGCSLISEIFVSAGTISAIYSSTFENCVALQRVEGLSSVIAVSADAFRYCNKLTLPSGIVLRNISDYAFIECSELSEVKFSTQVATIGWGAFEGCKNLKIQDNTLTMGVSPLVKKSAVLGFAAFSRCTALSRLSFTVKGKGGLSFGAFMGGFQFANCTALSLFILGPTTKTFSVDSYWFYNTPITDSSHLGDFGSIYMPASKYESFMALSGWSYYQSRIVSYTSVEEIPK